MLEHCLNAPKAASRNNGRLLSSCRSEGRVDGRIREPVGGSGGAATQHADNWDDGKNSQQRTVHKLSFLEIRSNIIIRGFQAETCKGEWPRFQVQPERV